MSDQRTEIERWLAQSHEDCVLVEVPAGLEDGARWTARLLVDGSVTGHAADWNSVRAWCDEGRRVRLVAAGGGGRWIVGHLLTRREAARICLEEIGGSGDAIGALWVRGDVHPAHHTWGRLLDIEIAGPTPPEPPPRSRTSSSKPWHLRPGEDMLLHSYWQSVDRPGTLFTEVGMPDDGRRKIDGVIVHASDGVTGGTSLDWDSIEPDAIVEVIEAKSAPSPTTKTGRDDLELLIGQVAAARAGVAWRLGRDLEGVRGIALTGGGAAPSLAAIARRLGLEAIEVEPSRIVQVPISPRHGDRVDALLDSVSALGLHGEVL